MKHRTFRQLLLLASLSIFSQVCFGWQTLTSNLDLSCNQIKNTLLDCSYRLLIPEPPLAISAYLEDTPVQLTEQKTYPWPGSVTAILFLIDTSDPAREQVVTRNADQLAKIMRAAQPHYRMGLASFDKDLQIEAPVGSPPSQILTSAKSLDATGLTTELYRSLLKAVDILAATNANRKVIMLFSDGQAEDKAYFHNDVITAARKNGVIINSLGFPRSVSLSVALQTLRRLSEETGGIYVEADNQFSLPKAFLDRPFENIDSGGRFLVELTDVTPGSIGKSALTLTFETDLGRISTTVPVTLPEKLTTKTVPQQITLPTQTNTVQAPPVQIVTAPVNEPDIIDTWLWYGVPVALIVLIVLTFITLILIYRKQGKRDTSIAAPSNQYKPYAYLIAQDEKATRYPITHTTWRIGRSKDNEMTLDDNSISRRHAEIQRVGNGKFVLYDLSSLNGVFVNEEKITKKKLEEGDIIEIGDIFLRFTQHPSDYQLGDDTVMQQTKSPFAH